MTAKKDDNIYIKSTEKQQKKKKCETGEKIAGIYNGKMEKWKVNNDQLTVLTRQLKLSPAPTLHPHASLGRQPLQRFRPAEPMCQGQGWRGGQYQSLLR